MILISRRQGPRPREVTEHLQGHTGRVWIQSRLRDSGTCPSHPISPRVSSFRPLNNPKEEAVLEMRKLRLKQGRGTGRVHLAELRLEPTSTCSRSLQHTCVRPSPPSQRWQNDRPLGTPHGSGRRTVGEKPARPRGSPRPLVAPRAPSWPPAPPRGPAAAPTLLCAQMAEPRSFQVPPLRSIRSMRRICRKRRLRRDVARTLPWLPTATTGTEAISTKMSGDENGASGQGRPGPRRRPARERVSPHEDSPLWTRSEEVAREGDGPPGRLRVLAQAGLAPPPPRRPESPRRNDAPRAGDRGPAGRGQALPSMHRGFLANLSRPRQPL